MMISLFRYILFVSCLLQQVNAQEKGLKIRSNNTTDSSPIDFNRRIALVIGNEQYEKDPLKNPVNDATRIAEVLRKYNFSVINKNNLTRKELNSLINDFGDSITAHKGVSFFYYSGHGLQYNSENYILPLNSAIEKEADIEDEAVKLGKVFEKMKQTGNGLNFVILDACRNNPYYTALPNLPKGLTDKEALPGNTSVFFATTPGNVALDGKGTNSPFTESLAEAITDSIEFYQVVRKVVKQVKSKTIPVQQPAITGSPEDEFYFTQKKSKPGLYLLSIGISNYQQGFLQLQYASKDAMDVARAFEEQKGFLYDNIHTSVIVDEAGTKNRIIATIAEIKQKVRPGDVIMMFFSGHNLISKQTGRSYFFPVDGDNNNIDSTGVDYEYIRSFLADMPCKSILFFDGSYNASTAKDLSQTENGVAIFTSALPGTFALEGPQWNNGLFARVLIDGINGAADEAFTGIVDLWSLNTYLEKIIRKESNNRQIPSSFFPAGLSNFKISKAIRRKEPEKNSLLIQGNLR